MFWFGNTLLFPEAEVLRSDYSGVLRDFEVYRFYNLPLIKEIILLQVKNRPVSLRYFISPRFSIVIRFDFKKNGYLFLTEDNFDFYNNGRLIEIIGNSLDKDFLGKIDCDFVPYGVDWKRILNFGEFVKNQLKKFSEVLDCISGFSGNRSIHIRILFKDLYPINQIFNFIKNFCDDFVINNKLINYDGTFVYGPIKPWQVRLDLLSNIYGRGMKILGSLDFNTGLVVSPIPSIYLDEFKKEDLSIKKTDWKKYFENEEVQKFFENYKKCLELINKNEMVY